VLLRFNHIASDDSCSRWSLALRGRCKGTWIVDAHRDGKRFVVHAEEKLTAFVELERAIYEFGVDLIS
jgi:hypothetical protein